MNTLDLRYQDWDFGRGEYNLDGAGGFPFPFRIESTYLVLPSLSFLERRFLERGIMIISVSIAHSETPKREAAWHGDQI